MSAHAGSALAAVEAVAADGAGVVPDYDGGSIVNVPASILAAFGCQTPSAPLRHDLVDPALLDAPGGVACLVVDALGSAQLQAGLDAGRAPHLQRLVDEVGPPGQLTSIFPSTTTAALTSLATAQPPAQHGILGHVLWLEQIQAACNVLHFAPVGRPQEAIDDDLLRCQPTIHERLKAAGVPSYAITASAYEGTAFTDLLQRGSHFLGYHTQSQLPALLEQALIDAKPRGRPHISLYWPHIDTIAHTDGPDLPGFGSEGSALELEFVDLMIGRLVDVCRRHHCALMITADHGQTLMDPERACVMPPDLLAGLSHRPTGGRRAAYLTCEDPQLLLDSTVAAASSLLPMDAVVEAGWFGGELIPEFRSRIGDWLALANDGVQFLIDEGDGVFPLRGGHAGISPCEMQVPILVVPGT
ncbi:MAG: hypothetical protein HN712_26575 [Gemmatimonadetes bacterium]|jgi:hypothetical protein|nr:hypothetical protein [Gemmatimonadota bacterium]MBT7863907.1 hypothetical protein [Gemmatimonadota bacterium]